MSGMESFRRFLENDRFARLLGIEILEAGEGFARCSLKIGDAMLNAKGVTQGGALFSLCDFTMALAANSRGRVALTVQSAVTYLKGTRKGDVLTAKTVELSCGNSIANYRVDVFNAADELVAVFHGTCRRTSETIPS